MRIRTALTTSLCSTALYAAIGCCTAAAAQTESVSAPQPVYFLLYSRYSDHVVPQEMEKRLNRLQPIMEQLKRDEPSASVLLEFSGAMIAPLKLMDAGGGHIGRLKEMSRQGLAEFGYDGTDEPTYRNRPRVKLRKIAEPERRWTERGEAADLFLRYFRAPFTGDADQARPGGLKLVQDTFGELALVSNWTQYVGSDAPELHRLSRLNKDSALAGFLAANPEWGIEGYANSLNGIASFMSASAPTAAPEVYWEGSRLRIAETGKRGVRPVSTTDGAAGLKAFIAGLDRSTPHVIYMEIVGEKRYLVLRSDGSVQWPPLVWAFDHPEEPLQPTNMRSFRGQSEVEQEYQTEQETLQWMVKEFFPANPGSRFVSVANLKKAVTNTVGSEIPAAEITRAAESIQAAAMAHRNFAGQWAQAGEHYFSTAEVFELLAASLAGIQKTGKAPATVRLESMYGPMAMSWDLGDKPVEVDANSVIRTAAEIAGRIHGETWTPVPANMVPSAITVEGQELNPARFLDLMAQVYLGARGKVRADLCMMFSPAGMGYPHNTPKEDMGNTWTLKPATLVLAK